MSRLTIEVPERWRDELESQYIQARVDDTFQYDYISGGSNSLGRLDHIKLSESDFDRHCLKCASKELRTERKFCPLCGVNIDRVS